MLAWLRSPRGSTVTATVVVVILALLWFAPWSRPLPNLPGLPLAGPSGPKGDEGPAAPASGPSTAATPPDAQRVGSAGPAAPVAPAASSPVLAEGKPAVAPTPQPPAAAAPSPEAATSPPQAPSFDVVRVEPSGATVIAGRGEPGSIVALMDGTQELAHVTVDGSGQFALLPPDLGEGSHYLTLRSGVPAGGERAGQGPLVSKQSVAVAVARAGANKPVVAMLTPDGPARVLSDGAPIGALPGSGAARPAAVAIEAVEAAAGGRFTVSGLARPGSHARIYLNGAFLAEVTADPQGRWAVAVQKGMRPGQYVIRADELAADGGSVAHRAEVPFTYPALVAEGAGRDLMTHVAPMPPARPIPGATSFAGAGATGLAGAGGTVVAGAGATGMAGAGATGMSGAGATAMADPGRTGDVGGRKPSLMPGRTASASIAGSAQTPTGHPAPTAVSSSAATGAPAAPSTPGLPPGAEPAPGQVARVASTEPPGETGPVAATIISDLRTATVSRGDSLWRISKRMLGKGLNYTEIYASNASQIRDPALIYPGQVFVVPNASPKEAPPK